MAFRRFTLQLAPSESLIVHDVAGCGVATCPERGDVLMVGGAETRDAGRQVWVCAGHVRLAIECSYTYVLPRFHAHGQPCQARKCGESPPTAYVELVHPRSIKILGPGWRWLCRGHCRAEGYTC